MASDTPQARYLRSPKGKAAQARYRATGAHRRNQLRYSHSPKGQAKQRAHRQSERGQMLDFFKRRRRRDVGGGRPGYTGDAFDKALNAAMREANERVYEELREVEDAGR